MSLGDLKYVGVEGYVEIRERGNNRVQFISHRFR